MGQAAGPLAVSAFPVLSLYSSSLDSIRFSQILLPLSISIASGLFLYLICSAVMRSTAKGCFIATCLIQLLFAYELVVPFRLDAFAVWRDFVYDGLFVFLAGVAIFALFTPRSMATAARVVSILGACILCAPIVQILWYETQNLAVASATPSPARSSPVAIPEGAILPDIYHIVLDGYSRDDVLKGLYSVDNTSFLNALRNRGFYVADESRSNYLQTGLSLPSTMNHEYLDRLQGPTTSMFAYRRYLRKHCFQESAVIRELRARGYVFVFFTSSLGELNIDNGADIELGPAAGLFDMKQLELMSGLLRSTPLRNEQFIRQWLLGSEEPNVLFQFRTLRQFKPLQKNPTFVFVHVLCPHPPFLFDRNGRMNSVDPGNMGDGSDFPGTDRQYIRGYSEQVLFVNQLILQTVDAILKNYPPEKRPVIIIQGDHGGGSHYNQNSSKDSLLWERASILNAFLFPAEREFAVYPSITPVNTYRVLFNGLFKANFKLLPDRTYFADKTKPYRQILLSEDSLRAPDAEMLEALRNSADSLPGKR